MFWLILVSFVPTLIGLDYFILVYIGLIYFGILFGRNYKEEYKEESK